MAGFSDSLETSFLERLFKSTAVPAITTLWLSLHSADSDTGASEITGTAYVRVQRDGDPNNSTNTNWTAVATAGTAKRVSNVAAVTWPAAGAGGWNSGNPITHVGLWSAVTAGTFYGMCTIASGGVVVLSGNTLSFPAGEIDFDLD